jgi:hypothetical protein
MDVSHDTRVAGMKNKSAVMENTWKKYYFRREWHILFLQRSYSWNDNV